MQEVTRWLRVESNAVQHVTPSGYVRGAGRARSKGEGRRVAACVKGRRRCLEICKKEKEKEKEREKE